MAETPERLEEEWGKYVHYVRTYRARVQSWMIEKGGEGKINRLRGMEKNRQAGRQALSQDSGISPLLICKARSRYWKKAYRSTCTYVLL